MRLRGGCHCGNITFAMLWEPAPAEIPARACTCSFCVKHGAAWTSTPDAVLRVEILEPARVTRYEQGTRTAQFHVCARCGVVPVVTCAIDGRLYAVVNVGALEGVDPALFRRTTATLDGEETGSRLARRARAWIANVEFVERGAEEPNAKTPRPPRILEDS